MLVLPWFAFVHVHKTGGGFVRKLLHDEYGSEIVYETPLTLQAGHESFDDLPRSHTGPVFAFVRNPWDWYVSWYHYVADHVASSQESSPFFDAVFAGGRNDFATAVKILCTGAAPHPLPRVQAAMEEGHDFCTAAVLFMLGSGVDDPRLTVGRFEHLREHIADFVARTDAPRKDNLAAAARSAPPERQSKHAPYREYYDDELRDLVGARAAWLVERYGYIF